MNIDQPVTNPSLIEAMKGLGEANNEVTNLVFFKELNKARLLAPVIFDPLPKQQASLQGKIVLDKDTRIVFELIANAAGKKYYPAFTDWPELGKWKKEGKKQTLIMTFDDYCAMIIRRFDEIEGLVINPFGINFIVGKDIIKKIIAK